MLTNFPVKVPYTTGPSMTRNTGPVFNKNPNPAIIEQKKQELAQWHGDLFALGHGAIDHGLVQKASRYCEFKETTNILELALQLEEDIAILHRGKLAAICFCFPSSWIPRTRIDQSLMDIHRPVGDGATLVKMSQRIAETMADTNQGSFKRGVWTISTSGALSQHPSVNRPVAEKISDLYFRVETQTTAPLGDGESSLFFVKIDTYPLEEIFAVPKQRELIIESINSMTDAILDYKNLRDIKKLIVPGSQ
jgi:hypothetical protein